MAAYQGGPGGTNGTGTIGQNFAAGMGKSVFDNARGLAQSGVGLAKLALLPTSTAAQITGATDFAGKPLSDAYAGLKAQQSDVNAQDAALMHTGSGLLGNISG